MFSVGLRTFFLGLLGAGLLVSASAVSQGQDENEPDGRIIQIGPADKVDSPAEDQHAGQPIGEEQPNPNPYWIGVLGGPVTPELRHHVDLSEDQGLLVRDVLPNSPAANAGIEAFDILLSANGEALHNMRDLVDLVREAGDNQSAIEIEVLRKGEVQTVAVTPEERPEEYASTPQHAPGGWGAGPMGQPGGMGQWFGQQFGQNGPQRFQFRTFGPGAAFPGQQLNVAQLPNGVSITVRKEGDGPAHITVKRGGEVWEVDASKPEDLDALPEDLRPLVEQMMEGGPAVQFDQPQMPGFGPIVPPEGFNEDFQKRIEDMERQMRELQKQLLGPAEESHENET